MEIKVDLVKWQAPANHQQPWRQSPLKETAPRRNQEDGLATGRASYNNSVLITPYSQALITPKPNTGPSPDYRICVDYRMPQMLLIGHCH